jgi:signal peptidase I
VTSSTTRSPANSGDPDLDSDATKASKASHWIRETIVVVAVALAIAVVLRLFVVQTYSIPSSSMEPTLKVGDRIVVDKLSYDLHGVHRGDIVVFARPANEHCSGPVVSDLVKRVVALPGETISLSGHGFVRIDGKRLDEPWLPSSTQGTTFDGPPGTPYSLTQAYTVPAGDYFVMGDNRNDSCDSRYWGPVAGSLIVGKVDLRIWPLTHLHVF